ncbi:hypothetical protein [Helicobacter sp. 11S02629-2]|uniref:hypothetical protein n=1 Tax=Helicobacter sp. 11S02629-2 TaxID=1476195 RepID=UPI000BA54870|nr:hypothetical protein [Helicobacter sp. 11S02629-2]PAF42754.1 hypothetical protein BKH40_07620 [Helicobacter sp. 11S02629-2]
MKAEAGKTYALIVDGFVHNVFTKENLPEWDEKALKVVEVPEDKKELVREGVEFKDNGFVLPSLEELKLRALNFLSNITDDIIDTYTERPPLSEKLTWEAQEKQALSLQAKIKDLEAKEPKETLSEEEALRLGSDVTLLAKARNIPLKDFVTKVLQKAGVYRKLLLMVLAFKQNTETKIQEAKDIASLNAIMNLQEPLEKLKTTIEANKEGKAGA